MPYGERVLNPAGDRAEGDKLFEQSIYGGATGALSIGMPLFKDLTDAAEFNTKIAATALVGPSASFPTPPGIVRTGGRVVLSTNANTNVNAFVGIFAPENPGEIPKNGDIVRILVYGEAIVSAISETGNANPLKVGDLLVAKTTVTSASTNAQTVSPRQTVAVVLATGAAVTNGAQIAAAASNVPVLVNAFVSQT